MAKYTHDNPFDSDRLVDDYYDLEVYLHDDFDEEIAKEMEIYDVDTQLQKIVTDASIITKGNISVKTLREVHKVIGSYLNSINETPESKL